MKLLVFAHTPPPHHGQSYMVQLMLEGFGGDQKLPSAVPAAEYGIECYHVNVQLSDDLEDIGSLRGSKLKRLCNACREALQLRKEFGIDTLYYVPAPAKASAIIRDWLVLAALRPFFKKVVLHWHAFGVGFWARSLVESPGGEGYKTCPPPILFGIFDPFARYLTRLSYRGCDLSIALTDYNVSDAEALAPKQTVVVPNGIPDQCGDRFPLVLERRLARLRDRQEKAIPSSEGHPQSVSRDAPTFDLLFLSHCTREKGLFVAMDAVETVNQDLVRQRANLRVRMVIAGKFQNESERAEFHRRANSLENVSNHSPFMYVGHVDSERKAVLLAECDALIFPTFFQPETFGLVMVEALSFGLPVIATKWRGTSDILRRDLPSLSIPENSEDLSRQLKAAMDFSDFAQLRQSFLERYSLPAFLDSLARNLKTV